MHRNNQKELICIRCPIGCRMEIKVNENGNFDITGNSCNRGAEYAKKELTNPTRMVTSTVRVIGGQQKVVPIKTKEDIPKEKIVRCMHALKDMEVAAPICIGEVILKNVADTGVDIVATKHVEQE